jgi:DNA-binding transcriptional LysR family regulator
MLLVETHAFVTVARSGSFTEAARRLSVPKSTLSRQVQRLEERLGARLLHRTTRRLSLTETGSAYLARCEHALSEIEDAERAALDIAGHPSGTLRVSTPFDFARDRLAPLLPEFRHRFPEVRLALELAQKPVDLVAEGYDVALRAGNLSDSDLVSRKIAASDLVLCASPNYLDRRGRPEKLADLAGHDLIAMGRDGRPLEMPIVGPDGPRAIPGTAWLVANEWGVLHRAIRRGLGIGLQLLPDVSEEIAGGALERVLPDYGVTGGGLYAVYPSRHHLTPKVRVFVDFLVEKMSSGLGPTDRPT